MPVVQNGIVISEKVLDRLSSPDDQELLIGEHDLANTVGKKYDIKRITVHPTFLKNNRLNDVVQNWEYDISIYELTKVIEEMASKPNQKPVAQAIHLPHPLDPSLFLKTKMTVSGWGRKGNGRSSKKLRAANVPLTAIHKCRHRTENMVCSGEGPVNSPGFGDGDSGG